MPYRIRHGSGKRPFQIINIQTGKVVGTSLSREIAQQSIGHRVDAEGKSKDIKKYKRVVDNKLKYFGETDFEKKTVRVNKSKKKNNQPGDILDTIVHEKGHVQHPNMKEKNVRKLAVKLTSRMTIKQKQKHYNLFK